MSKWELSDKFNNQSMYVPNKVHLYFLPKKSEGCL